MARQRVLSGMRPTGALHLGHYAGALGNWVRLQGEYECFYFVADWHAVSTMYEHTETLAENTGEIVLDWLSVGLDPEVSTLFLQSAILQHAELFLLLSMITPVPWLERVPSYKEMQQNLSDRDLSTVGFLSYPLLQTADIVIYRANFVPVGEDQLPHLELSREIVRRFAAIFGRSVFPEPAALLTEAPRLPGTDGRKMSKSFGNAIFLKDGPEAVWEKLRPMVTDPARVRRSDPGDPDKCPVWDLHRHFTPEGKRAELAEGCRRAGIGCIECKKAVYQGIEAALGPVRERRAGFSLGQVREILADGCTRARDVAEKTMEEVRSALRLYRC
jgi:tryptophanyl-tRNA synthetase